MLQHHRFSDAVTDCMFYPKLKIFASSVPPENHPGHFQEAEIIPESFLGPIQKSATL